MLDCRWCHHRALSSDGPRRLVACPREKKPIAIWTQQLCHHPSFQRYPQLQHPSISLPCLGVRRPSHTISPPPQDHHPSSSRLPFTKTLQTNPPTQHRSTIAAHPQVKAAILHLPLGLINIPSPNQAQEQPSSISSSSGAGGDLHRPY